MNLGVAALLLICCLFLGCKKDDPPPNQWPDTGWERNPRIKQLTFNGTVGWPPPSGTCTFPVHLSGKNIAYLKKKEVSTSPPVDGLWRVDTNSSLTNPLDSLLRGNGYDYLAFSSTREMIVVAESVWYAASGKLYIMAIIDGVRERVAEDLPIAYGAVFTEADSILIVYGEGRDPSHPRGYYRYARRTRNLSLLFAEPLGLYGFDVTRDGRTLIYPRYPRFLTRDLRTGIVDTGAVYAQWLRLSPDQSRIVFTSNTIDLYDSSRIGIVDRLTNGVSWLDIHLIDTKYGATYAAHPDWSDDSGTIFFSGTPQATFGVVGPLGPTNIFLYRLR